jgi:hypothetical protein
MGVPKIQTTESIRDVVTAIFFMYLQNAKPEESPLLPNRYPPLELVVVEKAPKTMEKSEKNPPISPTNAKSRNSRTRPR